MAPDTRASPISFLHTDCHDRLSGELIGGEADRGDRKLEGFLQEMKVYSEGLEKRNLDMACDLERERTRNKQLMSAIGCLMVGE